MIAAIDPGATGAIAFLDEKENMIVAVEDMPVMAATSGKGVMLNASALASILQEHKPKRCVIEIQHSMPGQGVRGVFALGMNYGGLLSTLMVLQIPIVFVAPSAWKKEKGLTGKDKDASRTLAITSHPEIADQLTRKKDHNRAEAILLTTVNQGF